MDRNEWVWCGYPGHFIGASSCRFHLSTRVGHYRVSTVGDYRPAGAKKAEPIGAGKDSLYETFVFPVTGHGEHGEGEVISWAEIDSERYADSTAAEAGHMRFCERYAARKVGSGNDDTVAESGNGDSDE